MAESNATQVILTDDGIKIIKAQNTADNAASQAGNADSAALIAQSTANAAKEAADSTYAYANSEIAVQSTATAKAQSTADNAFSQAQAASSQASSEIAVQSNATAKAQSAADNAFSQATTALDNGNATSQAVTDLKDGSKLTIADLENGLATKVANSEYASYKVQTASQIAQKVDNGAFSVYQQTTADLIASKVATKDFSAYQATTAKSIESKVDNGDFNTYKTQTADLIDDKVSNSEYASDKTQTASEIADRVSNSAFSTYQTQTASQIASKVDNGEFSTYKKQTADLISQKVATKDFSAYQATTAKAISSKVESNDFNSYKQQTDKAILSKVATKDFSTYQTQTANDINLRVTKKDLIDEINLQAGNTLISSSGQLTLSGKNIYFDTANPVIIPSANITGTLNGKTINGSTFNAGNKLNQYGNTSYPLTINQDGSVTSTSFGNIANDPAALRTVIKDGSVKTNFRGMKQLSTGIYPAADVALGAGQLALLEGYSTSQDPNFTATGMKTTGYAILDASAGLSLHGKTQSINFSGKDQDQTTGITMDSYGNMYALPNSLYWRIGDANAKAIADFGFDTTNVRRILLYRNTEVGNLFLGVGHTIGMLDKKPLYFKQGTSYGNMLDIKAGTVYYTGLTKSSLLSVKKDVQKADTAYWAQLVNSIDLATYQYKSDDNTSHIRLSSIVDDVNDTKQWQLPDVFVSRDEDGKLCGVDDSVLLNATLATVQEQQKEIDQLNGHNMELEARLNKLEAKLNG